MSATNHNVNNLCYFNCVKYCHCNVYCSSCQTDNLRYFTSQAQELVYACLYYVRHISSNREP